MMAARLGRGGLALLLLAGAAAALAGSHVLAAIHAAVAVGVGAAPTSLRHVLAAIHAAVVVPVGTAAVRHAMALMLAGLMLAGLTLRRSLMLTVLTGLGGLVLLMVLMLLRRGRRLGSGGQSEYERHRGNDNLHLNSPEAFDRMNEPILQAGRGGGGSDSG